MVPTFRIRHAHRGLAVVFGVQLLFWTLSGIYFAWTNIAEIRGEDLLVQPEPVTVDGDWMAPTTIIKEGQIQSLSVINLFGQPFYRIQPVEGDPLLASAMTGEIRGELTRDEAVALARDSFLPDAEVAEVVYLNGAEVGRHHEYRGRPVPVWQIEFDHGSGTRVYVSAREALVETHRNSSWRIFDFLWMMHTMDYLGRDNINNPVLRIFSVLALSVIVSGFVLWAVTNPRFRRRPQKKGDS